MRHTILSSLLFSACASLCLGTSFSQTTVFVGSSFTGTTGDAWFLVDVDSSQLIAEGASRRTDNVRGAFFHPTSAQLVVCESGGEEVNSSPLLGLTPDFQNPIFRTPILGAPINDCFYDARFQRIFVLTRGTTATGEVFILDGDPVSATYGDVMHTITLPKVAASFTLSDDSTLLTAPPTGFESPMGSSQGSIPIIDVDPASPGFLSITQSATTDALPDALASDSFFSPDNRYVSVMLFRFFNGVTVARYDRQTQTWSDVDPSIPGNQDFRLPLSLPPTVVRRPGSDSVFLTTGSGLARLEEPVAGSVNFNYVPLQSYSGNIAGASLSPNRSRLAFTFSGTPRLAIASATDGAILSETLLDPNVRNITTVAWSQDRVIGTPYCGPAAPNASGFSGQLAAEGTTIASDNDLSLIATNLPPSSFGLLLTSRDQAVVPNPGGSAGTLCLGGSIGRFTLPSQIQQASPAGQWEFRIDLTQQPQLSGFVSVVAGDTWNYQAWFRDLTASGQATSNFTDGVTVDFN